MVAIPVALLVFLIVFTLASAGMNLVARNISTNLAHLNSLTSVQRLTGEVHSSVVEPWLTGTLTSGTFPLVSGTGPAAGVGLNLFVAGPFAVHNNSNANNTSIAIELNGAVVNIQPGMHLQIPSYQDASGVSIDKTITSVTNGTFPNLGISGTLGVTIVTQGGTGGGSNGTQIVPVYITLPVNYYVSGQSLIRRDACGNAATVLQNVLTPLPFTKPDTTNARFLGVHLGASNPDYSNRGFRSTNMLIDNISVPSRSQLNP